MEPQRFYLHHPKIGKISGYRLLPLGRPKSALLMVHGFSEHKGLLLDTAKILCRQDTLVTLFDLPGFGESAGDLADLESFDEYVSVIDLVYQNMRWVAGDLPFHIFGNSLGAMLTLLFTGNRTDVNGIILTSPFIHLSQPKRIFFKILTEACSLYNRKTKIRSFVVYDHLSHNRDTHHLYRTDPLRGRHLSAGFGREVFRRIPLYNTVQNLPDIPTLIFKSAADKVVHPTAIDRMFYRFPNPDKTLYAYASSAHDLLHDHMRQDIIDKLSAWIIAHR